MLNHVIIEGIDRLGKDTLINGIQNEFGFFQVLHYQKPLLLEKYKREAIAKGAREPDDIKAQALKAYQFISFVTMFKLMKSNTTRIICNRAHLGETVYAKRYRGYDGNFVFDIENLFSYLDGPLDRVLLVTLHTSDFSFISDDGHSIDVTKREEEQSDFLAAFDRSKIKNKMLIDVNDGTGKFVTSQSILEQVVTALK